MEAADAISSFTAGTDYVAMATRNGYVKVDGGGFESTASPVQFTALGTSGLPSSTYNIIHSRNGFADSGVLSRVGLNGTGTRNVSAGANGILTVPASDERLKQNIEPLTLGLNIVEKLNPKKFEFKDEPGTVEYGLIAQEVRTVLNTLGITDNTNLVFEDESEGNLSRLPEGETGPVLGVEYMKLIPILLNSVKELQARVEILEKEKDNS
jgi:hypothetical protein